MARDVTQVDLESLLNRVLTLGGEGDWGAAADLLREHLPDFEDEPAVHCWLGVAERELGLDGVAYERFKRALALDPRDPYVLATAGNGVAAFDDPGAEAALRTAALTAPDVLVARMLYGAYLSREGFHDEAIAEIGAARRLDEDDPQAAYELGVAHALAGDFDRAADAMADAARLDPSDGWTRVTFGLVLLEAGRHEEAAGELAEGSRLRPDDVEGQLLAALAAAATGHQPLAYEMLERGRLGATEADEGLFVAVEDRVDQGPEAAAKLLAEELAPDALRGRLRERP